MAWYLLYQLSVFQEKVKKKKNQFTYIIKGIDLNILEDSLKILPYNSVNPSPKNIVYCKQKSNENVMEFFFPKELSPCTKYL